MGGRGQSKWRSGKAGHGKPTQSGPTLLPFFAQPRLTSTIFVAEVWETPDIAQTDKATSHGKHKVDLAGPLLPLWGLPLSLILRPGAWALSWGWLQDVLVEVFQTLQLLFGGHLLLTFYEGQNRTQCAVGKGQLRAFSTNFPSHPRL